VKTITITLHNGATSVETSGFKGKSCQSTTAQIEAALGTVQSVKKKPEFHAQTSATTYQNANA
jgi:hypothetical protein